MKKFIYVFTVFSFFPVSLCAQNINLGVDLFSRYVSRGDNLGGNSASVQPYISFALAKGFDIGVWGAYSLASESQTSQELDLYITYTTPNEMLSITLSDYFFPNDLVGRTSSGLGTEFQYFNYDSDKTGHVFELMATLKLPTFPLAATIATNFAGADKKNDGSGNQAYSTYVQLDYTATIGETDLSLFVGSAFADEGNYYLRLAPDDNAAINNVGFIAGKSIKISDTFSLPVSVSLVFNPYSEQAFFLAGLSF